MKQIDVENNMEIPPSVSSKFVRLRRLASARVPQHLGGDTNVVLTVAQKGME